MNKDEFWRIIDNARESASHWSSIPALLADSLSKLDAADILHWHGILTEYHALSYKDRLWDAAIVMLGSCSDDAFEDFRGWLIAKGKNAFLEALADPDFLVTLESVQTFGRAFVRAHEDGTKLPAFQEIASLGDLMYVASCAYERKPGTGSFCDAAIPALSAVEKAEIAGEIRYTEGIDSRLAALAWTSPIEAAVKLQQAFPRLYTLLYPSLAPEVSKLYFPVAVTLFHGTAGEEEPESYIFSALSPQQMDALCRRIRDQIADNSSEYDLLTSFSCNLISAVPSVEEVDGELFGVVELIGSPALQLFDGIENILRDDLQRLLDGEWGHGGYEFDIPVSDCTLRYENGRAQLISLQDAGRDPTAMPLQNAVLNVRPDTGGDIAFVYTHDELRDWIDRRRADLAVATKEPPLSEKPAVCESVIGKLREGKKATPRDPKSKHYGRGSPEH